MSSRAQKVAPKLNWFQQQKHNAGYWWKEKKREAFFAIVACFALGQVAYREMSMRGIVKQEYQQSRSQPPPINLRQRKREE
jgi:hypothetical protein